MCSTSDSIFFRNPLEAWRRGEQKQVQTGAFFNSLANSLLKLSKISFLGRAFDSSKSNFALVSHRRKEVSNDILRSEFATNPQVRIVKFYDKTLPDSPATRNVQVWSSRRCCRLEMALANGALYH